jgi:uncharacterized integral membrane protein (TIGR00697 family)
VTTTGTPAASSASDLHPIEASALHARRERVFLILAGLFLGSMTMLNILGVTRFLDLSFTIFGMRVPMPLAIGVLPYPLTFLCTDFISEIYGRKRANFLVWVGFLVNLWLAVILWVGGALPGFDAPVPGPDGRLPIFFEIRTMTLGVIAASMIAYLSAQLCDVWVFHFWKRLTKGRHLWLRNNGSTMLSQLVDTVLISFVLYASGGLGSQIDSVAKLIPLVVSSYAFKCVFAVLDTPLFYLGVYVLRERLPSAD